MIQTTRLFLPGCVIQLGGRPDSPVIVIWTAKSEVKGLTPILFVVIYFVFRLCVIYLWQGFARDSARVYVRNRG